MPDSEEFGRTWDEQLKGSPVGVLPAEEQVSDPEEDIDPLSDEPEATATEDSAESAETDDSEEPELGLQTVPDPEAEADGGEGTTEPDPSDTDPVLNVHATLTGYSAVTGVSGVTVTMKFAIDAAYVDEVTQLMGERDYGLVVGKIEICSSGVTIKSITAKTSSADGGGIPTAMVLHAPQSELMRSLKVVRFLDKNELVQLTPVQLTVFGAKAQ